MTSAGGLWIGVAALAVATPCLAGPWTQPKGQGQIIVKFEEMRADQGFDPDGNRVDLPADRRDTALSAFIEYGLTDTLTFQFKGDWQSGEDAFVDYEGRGPLEVGVTWRVWSDDRTSVSLYGGYADGGEGRNAGYAAPGVGDQDWEVRASVGRSFAGNGKRFSPRSSFIDVQVARRMRQGLPDETRLDATAGSRYGQNWMLLTQAFGGQTDDDGAQWLSVETSVVRDLGAWSLQAGWRQTVLGRETPAASGPVVAVWRRF